MLLLTTTNVCAPSGMDAIANMSTLEELNIGYTGVGDTGVASLGQITSLRVLNMDSCDITDGCDPL